MAELLKVVTDGETCEAEAEVTGSEISRLVCNLQPGHPGPLHYDKYDKIWWLADA